eukprot:Seg2598.3 transcript_id=Seg2598.3/GoldUCD/mRNA.D3Y31 product="Coiled-coil domain-containing protein 152" protein_id=Seg2598.3/GoldUCD/D3Y31
MQKQIDVDEVIKYVHTWDEYTDKLIEENKDLKRQISVLEKRCELNRNSEAQAKQEINQLHQIITSLQETVNSQCNILEENEAKKSEIAKLRENIVSLKKMVTETEAEAREKIDAINEYNKHDREKMRIEFEEHAIRIKQSMQKLVDERDRKLQDFVKQTSEMERDRQTDLMKMRLEFETKLQKMQKQTSTAEAQGSNASSAMVRNDILRRKLQHIQAEADKEINELKMKICNLEKILEKQQGQKKRKLSFH